MRVDCNMLQKQEQQIIADINASAVEAACPACGVPFVDHPGIIEMCRRYRRLADMWACVPDDIKREAKLQRGTKGKAGQTCKRQAARCGGN